MTELKVSIVDHPFTAESWVKPASMTKGLLNSKESNDGETVHQVSGYSLDGNRTIQIIVKSGNESDDSKLITDLLNDGLNRFNKTPKKSEGMFLQDISDKSEEEYTPLHVDYYIDYGLMGHADAYPEFVEGTDKENHRYARWVLNHFRLSAICRGDFDWYMKDHKLFATYEGKRYRVTGASRFGDVWLHSNPEVSTGYEHRVPLDKLLNLSNSWE